MDFSKLPKAQPIGNPDKPGSIRQPGLRRPQVYLRTLLVLVLVPLVGGLGFTILERLTPRREGIIYDWTPLVSLCLIIYCAVAVLALLVILVDFLVFRRRGG